MAMQAKVLDKQSPVPLYYQLAEVIKERIRGGELQPGDQLPAERDLAVQAGISRMTARQAIAYLVREGTLISRHGAGTFVAEPKLTHDALHLLGFTEETMRQGGKASSHVLEQTVVSPPPGVVAGLELPDDARVVKIVRLRLFEAVPLLLETSFLPAALCPGLEDEDLAAKSLYAVLEQRYGLRTSRARQTLEATLPNALETNLFGIQPTTAMFLVEGVTYREHGGAVEYFKALYRGDRFKFELESRRDTPVDVGSASRLGVMLS